MARYSIYSERLYCEQLAYNLLWLWFLDRELDEGGFDPTVFTHNYDRVLLADVAQLFLAVVYDLSRQEGWTSDAHFAADGTLIEAWASLKSFVRKDGKDQAKVKLAKNDDPGSPTKNRHGLCAAITGYNPIAQDEPTVALRQRDEPRQLHRAQIITVGADKAYHRKKFVSGCRERKIAPHTACKEGFQIRRLDERAGRPVCRRGERER